MMDLLNIFVWATSLKKQTNKQKKDHDHSTVAPEKPSNYELFSLTLSTLSGKKYDLMPRSYTEKMVINTEWSLILITFTETSQTV